MLLLEALLLPAIPALLLLAPIELPRAPGGRRAAIAAAATIHGWRQRRLLLLLLAVAIHGLLRWLLLLLLAAVETAGARHPLPRHHARRHALLLLGQRRRRLLLLLLGRRRRRLLLLLHGWLGLLLVGHDQLLNARVHLQQCGGECSGGLRRRQLINPAQYSPSRLAPDNTDAGMHIWVPDLQAPHPHKHPNAHTPSCGSRSRLR